MHLLTPPTTVAGTWVWWARTDVVPPDEASLLASQWCSEPELRRIAGLRRAADRHDRAVSYLVVRAALGAVGSVAPRDVRVDRDAAGRPVWDGDGDLSLSHARGFVLVGLGMRADARVGVDVERRDALDDAASAAVAQGFSPAEQAWLAERRRRNAGSPHDSVGDTLRVWVRKEAVTKADGRGLLAPVADVTVLPQVDLRALGPLRSWTVRDLDGIVPDDVVGAVAVRSDEEAGRPRRAGQPADAGRSTE